MKKTLYEVLRVSQSADADIIEAAYQLIKRKLEERADSEAQNELKSVQWAYQTLINADKRATYDRQLSGDVPNTAMFSNDEMGGQSGGFMDWWGSNKVTAIIAAVALLAGANLYFDYQKEASKTEVLKTIVDNDAKNDGKLIDVDSSIAQQEQERRRVELEYRNSAAARAIDMQRQQRDQQLEMQRQQRDQQIEMQRQQFEVQKQRQEASLKSQQQQLEQQRIQREQRYYSCYNAAWDRFQGDGARAAAACLAYK